MKWIIGLAALAFASTSSICTALASNWEYYTSVDPMDDVKTEAAIFAKETSNPLNITGIGFICEGDKFIFSAQSGRTFRMSDEVNLAFRIDKNKAIQTTTNWLNKDSIAAAVGNDALGYAKAFASAKDSIVVKIGDSEPVIYKADSEGIIERAVKACGLSLN